MNLPKKILVPLDFSEAAAPVLECAVIYAEAFDASLIVMHAADDPVLNAPSTSDEYRQRFEEELDEKLNHLVGKDVRQRVNIQLVTTSGGAAVEVCSYAEQNDVDLIIMGTHGRGAIAKMILGSVCGQSRSPSLVPSADDTQLSRRRLGRAMMIDEAFGNGGFNVARIPCRR